MILKTLQIIILDNMRYISTFIFEKKKKKKARERRHWRGKSN